MSRKISRAKRAYLIARMDRLEPYEPPQWAHHRQIHGWAPIRWPVFTVKAVDNVTKSIDTLIQALDGIMSKMSVQAPSLRNDSP